MSENVSRRQEMPEEEDEHRSPQNEEEWLEIVSRFEREGLEWTVSTRRKLLSVWRWLSDAENNLASSRNQLEKLRNQQSEELKEVETYVEHIRQLSAEKIEALEDEKEELSRLVEELRSNGEEVKEMLTQAGLTEILNSTLSEQVAYLLVLRSRLSEDLETERGKNHNLTDSLKLTQFQQLLDDQKADFEDELRHQRELTKQVKEELKRSHEIEILQVESKLNSSQLLVKELEERLRFGGAVDSDAVRMNERLLSAEDKVKRLETTKKQLETDNEALTYKVSELLVECEEKEAHLRRFQMINVGVKPYSRRGSSVESPKRNRNIADNKFDQDPKLSQQMKKLERDVLNLQEQLATAGGRHEALALQYQQRRAEGRTKMQRLKDVFQAKQSSLREQITELEAAVTVVRRSLSWEKECRQKIQTDFAGLQLDRSDLVKRVMASEEELRDKTLQLKSLNVRLDLMEKDNVKLAKEMAALKKIFLQEALFSNKKLVNSESTKKSPNVSPSRVSRLQSVLVPASKGQAEVTV